VMATMAAVRWLGQVPVDNVGVECDDCIGATTFQTSDSKTVRGEISEPVQMMPGCSMTSLRCLVCVTALSRTSSAQTLNESLKGET
jgi:hypothetical protein